MAKTEPATKSERMTPTSLKSPSMTYKDKMAIGGGEPGEKDVKQIDKAYMPDARKTAPGSVGF